MDNIKRIVNQKHVGFVTFDLNHLYSVVEFINKINERLKKNPGNYILFDFDSGEDATGVFINIISAREETDDEFNGRLAREKKSNDDFILRQEKDEYIQYLSLKAKFENK